MTNGMKGFLGSVHNQPTVVVNQKTPKAKRTLQGGMGYDLDLEERLCNAFTMGLIRGNFFTSQEEVVKECRDLFEEALKKAPELATKYAIYGAEDCNMKFMPTLWLVYLSTLSDKKLFNAAFPRIIAKNVNLLHQFVDLCRQSDIRPGGIHMQKVKQTNRGLGQGLKKRINKWMYMNLNAYNVSRFTGKLEDVCRLTRPEDKTEELKDYFQYIFKPKEGGRRLTFKRASKLQETIDILQNPERTPADFAQALKNIEEEKLQMDEIKFTFGKLNRSELQMVYMFFVPGMRYAAMVTNLVAIERAFATNTHKVMKKDPMGSGKMFEQIEVLSTDIPQNLIDIVAKKLANYDDYRASKLLFFRLLTASEMIITSKWRKALNEVLKKAGQHAFSDLPEGYKIMCSTDTSGSMSWPEAQVTNTLYAVDVASYLTAAVAQSTGAQAYATASMTKTVPMGDDLIDNAIKIKQTNVGGGTNFGSLLDNYNGANIVIMITDGQQSDNIESRWRQLNKPAHAKLIIWRVTGWNYRNKVSADKDVLYLSGFSDNLMNILANLITGKAGQPEIVRNMQI